MTPFGKTPDMHRNFKNISKARHRGEVIGRQWGCEDEQGH